MVIHHIEMHDVGTGLQHIGDLLTQAGKIRRQDGGCDLVFRHVVVLIQYFNRFSLQKETRTLP